MGLLDKLWDDTVAGPRPESGLGKLRKHSTFAFRSNSGKEVESADGGNVRLNGGDLSEEAKSVTRSIMIIKPRGNLTVGNGSAPASPAGSTPPVSPFSGTRDSNRFRRRSTSDVISPASSSAPGSGSGAATTSAGSAVGNGSWGPPSPYDV